MQPITPRDDMDYSAYSDDQLLAMYHQAQFDSSQFMLMSQILKISMNSLYGAINNKYLSQFFDVRIGEAITTGGQVSIQNASHYVNRCMSDIVGIRKDYVTYVDTDSGYYDLDQWVKSNCEGMTTTEIVDAIDRFNYEVLQPVLNDASHHMQESLNCDQNQFFMKREKIYDSIILKRKKRYVLNAHDNEGTRYAVPKMAVTGLESVRTNIPEIFRGWLKECYKIALQGTEDELQKRVREMEQEFLAIPIWKFAESKGMSDMDKYRDVPNSNRPVKGTPKHVKAAMQYNLQIAKHGMTQCKEFASGDKVYYLDLRERNPFGIDCIGFDVELPPEFGMDKWINRGAVFEKNFLNYLGDFLTAVGWTPKKINKLAAFFVAKT